MNLKRSILLLLAALTACGEVEPMQQPVAGYQAIRFRSAISIRDHALNRYTIAAGSTFVADRVTDSGVVYCGQATINDDAKLWSVCFGLKDENTLVVGPGAFLKQVDRPVPPGTLEIIRVKL